MKNNIQEMSYLKLKKKYKKEFLCTEQEFFFNRQNILKSLGEHTAKENMKYFYSIKEIENLKGQQTLIQDADKAFMFEKDFILSYLDTPSKLEDAIKVAKEVSVARHEREGKICNKQFKLITIFVKSVKLRGDRFVINNDNTIIVKSREISPILYN